MKLSKKSAAIQRAIHDALASGKALGGLLVGFAATVAGCGERHTPANTMGKYPSPYYQENATNENTEVFVTDGEPLSLPPEPEAPPIKQEPSETNAVQEQQCEWAIRGEVAPSVTTNAVNEADDEAVVMGGVGGDS